MKENKGGREIELYKKMSADNRQFLKDKLGIVIQERDYSNDEIEQIYSQIEDFHILKSFDQNYKLSKDGEKALDILYLDIW
ncbi:hypothetical protein ACFC37_02970 [Enterococcus durans]